MLKILAFFYTRVLLKVFNSFPIFLHSKILKLLALYASHASHIQANKRLNKNRHQTVNKQ